ncbi:MAG: DinB family protein [Meiothermus sp.]|nr:DinB family protein [Meiothermus sp.]
MPSTGAEYAVRFMMHRGALVDLLESVPADKAGFVPWEGAMDFAKMADHMSGAGGFFATLIKGGERVRPEPSASYHAALENLKAGTAATVEMLKALTPEQIGASVTAMGGRTVQVGSLIDYMIEHEAHHKGQVFTMMRMAGLETPKSWVKWP